MNTPHAFIRHLVSPVLPETIPAAVAPRGHFRPNDDLVLLQASVDVTFLIAPPDAAEVKVVVHAVIDRDYEGQYAYLQVCRRPHNQVAFGSWHYGFYYRGGDSTWDHWTLDIVCGDRPPSYLSFGAYVDTHRGRG